MGASDRNIQHLRLRAPSAQMAVHAAHRLEDALRCASLPDTGERLLLVRRLHLGRLPAGCSSQSLSLLIEQRVGAVGGEWVRGDDEARAARSDTVFFASRLQAAQIALRRRAMGLPLDGWHWPLALPGVAVHAHAQAFLAQLFESVLCWPEAAAAAPVLIAEAQAVGQGAWWNAHLPPVWRERLAPHMQARTAGGSRAGPAPRPTAPTAPPTGALLGSAQAREAAEPGTGAQAPSDHGVHHAPPPPGPLVDAALDANLFRVSPARSKTGAGTGDATAAAPVAVAGPSSRSSDAGDPLSAATPFRAPPAGDRTAVERVSGVCADAGVPWSGAVATGAGGLLFLWPVLERLGAAAWDARHPDAWLAPRVLGLALRRLRVPASDPAWALCASLPHPAGPPPTPDEQAALWLRACCRHLRREPHFGLARLVVRPAWLRWSATHIDVHFRPRDADLRVRRAALDTDPGWVDALQRVVVFHYDREGPGT